MLGHVSTITRIVLSSFDAWLLSEDPSPKTIMETKQQSVSPNHKKNIPATST
jgi:hypothetical protein